MKLADEQARIKRICEAINLPAGRWALSGSGSMIMYGIERKPRDLDIFCATQTWFSLYESRYRVTVHELDWELFTTDPDDSKRRCDPPYLYRVIYGLEVNIFSEWRKRGGNAEIDVAFWIHNAVPIDGIPCVPLNLLSNWKMAYGRAKDMQDVELIRRFYGLSNLPR